MHENCLNLQNHKKWKFVVWLALGLVLSEQAHWPRSAVGTAHTPEVRRPNKAERQLGGKTQAKTVRPVPTACRGRTRPAALVRRG